MSASPRWGLRRRRYLRESSRPLNCLLFLLPLALAYEVLSLLSDRDVGHNLLAHSAIAGVLGWFGLVGIWVPPVVLIVALLVWHRRQHHRWQLSFWVLPWMLLESLALALPLLTLSALFGPPPGGGVALRVQLVQALGAGVYEELVFRLLLIAGLAWIFAEVLHLGRQEASWTAVGLAAVVFALCHFEPIGSDAFAWGPFWFRLAAGAYLSAVFLGRGLGIASGSHAAYNLLLVWLRSGAA